MTRMSFIEQYTASLCRVYPWATDKVKLFKYLRSVVDTLDGGNSWACDGACIQTAWQAIGGQGKVSLKALRALNP